MAPFSLPADSRIRRVASFEELVSTPFENGINALCWPRVLPGDYREVVQALAAGPGIMPLDDSQLRRLPLRRAGQIALEALLEDRRRLQEHGLDPVLETVNGYPPVDDPGALRTDVCSFHVDSATDEADTWLCTYFGPPSEGLCNEEALRHVDVPETRAMLLGHFGGADDEAFLDYLSENYFDLHYATLPGARPYSFGLGNLWRIAVDYPGSPVPPCIHRAPDPVPGELPRLLLIS
jgi:hypothetical protein